MGSFNTQAMADYWAAMIREGRDAFRTYVSDPALYEKLQTLAPHRQVLDAGCGEGYVSRWLAQQGQRVTGVDLSPSMIALASQAAIGTETYQVGDLTALPFDDHQFDAAVSNMVLMELAQPERAIGEIARVLAPGGRFILQILHPFTFTSNRGVSGGKSIGRYFDSHAESEHFMVDGRESPFPSTRFHHPLSRYMTALRDHGFLIASLEEPVPIASTPPDHPIHYAFKEPWILLVDAVKKS